MKRPLGSRWRMKVDLPDGAMTAQNVGEFDELVLEHALHLERMNETEWWCQIGDAHLWITIGKDGYAKKVTLTEGVKKVHRDHIELSCDWRPKKPAKGASTSSE